MTNRMPAPPAELSAAGRERYRKEWRAAYRVKDPAVRYGLAAAVARAADPVLFARARREDDDAFEKVNLAHGRLVRKSAAALRLRVRASARSRRRRSGHVPQPSALTARSGTR